ncbi:F-box protein [Candidatus Odyssella thessalonicensis]|uniref:F-box protein n=1 Tax=Candidatus Odyssella thessalonicensis TaxID=84647 RepID=UPI000225B6DC|nr:F-box protein [Candidatus Odyssella thessalonicensis]
MNLTKLFSLSLLLATFKISVAQSMEQQESQPTATTHQQESDTVFSKLNDDVILVILSKLDYDNLKTVRLVSKKLNEISCHKYLWQNLSQKEDKFCPISWPEIDHPQLNYELKQFGGRIDTDHYKKLVTTYPSYLLIPLDLAYGVIFNAENYLDAIRKGEDYVERVYPYPPYSNELRLDKPNIANLQSVEIKLETAKGRVYEFITESEIIEFMTLLYSVTPLDEEKELCYFDTRKRKREEETKQQSILPSCWLSMEDLPVTVTWVANVNCHDTLSTPEDCNYDVVYWVDDTRTGWRPMFMKKDTIYKPKQTITFESLFPEGQECIKTIIAVNEQFSAPEDSNLKALPYRLRDIDCVIETKDEDVACDFSKRRRTIDAKENEENPAAIVEENVLH